jgi:hypothetical protein
MKKDYLLAILLYFCLVVVALLPQEWEWVKWLMAIPAVILLRLVWVETKLRDTDYGEYLRKRNARVGELLRLRDLLAKTRNP